MIVRRRWVSLSAAESGEMFAFGMPIPCQMLAWDYAFGALALVWNFAIF
jgi:hypothetical protein